MNKDYEIRKYVWWSAGNFLVFDEREIHEYVAKAHSGERPTDAGFLFHFPETGKVKIFGESISLGLKCDKSHEAEIAEFLNGKSFCRRNAGHVDAFLREAI